MAFDLSSAVRLRIGASVAGLFLLASTLCHAQVEDVALKAAFIYNFALFTTWPPTLTAATSFNVCVAPGSPLGDNLRRLGGKSINGKPWTVREMPADVRKGDCDVAVLGKASQPLSLSSPGTTLVIRDGGIAGKNGAAITLITEDNHVHFDIDTAEAERNGLRFSSKLLSLARNVL
ncbi:hypothetical protein R69658_06344 [Paraburkholderia aspalathi]|uniref:Transmembrane protein n=1 Tax=Paraburkholderia aspalathi TaxID=1324617 RepID=A0ABM8STM0_9BURK|nr:YfiR family protein [Paraburkholderia aspalathi]MBK3822698.1 YfiR family protein [Paraburkholderia aspalathi]MBK3834503.1 YfiR family protein [Paraburkholderia aspalathi]MBK3864256.1 YfiR family protein [Paraburkholderia aspalathi]CAE6832363.1 hypothetical protein R69658_06344 [Paraburkholderia aspalathi]